MVTPSPSRTILKAGDSLTDGFGSTDGNGWRAAVMASIPRWLEVGLVPLGSSATSGGGATGWQDYMSGVSGAETPVILAALTIDVPLFKPDVVTIYAGTNDSNHRVSGFGTPPTLAETVANIGAMITLCQNNFAEVVLICPLSPNVDPTYDAAIQVQDAAVLAMVATHPWAAHVQLVDGRTPITNIASWQVAAMADNTHMNDTGYAAIAVPISAGIAAAL